MNEGCSVGTAKIKLEPRSADAATLGAGLHPLSGALSHCTAVRQNSYGHYRAGGRMEPDHHTKVSVFYIQLSAMCWDLLHKSIQRYSSEEIQTSKVKMLLCEAHFALKLFTYLSTQTAK